MLRRLTLITALVALTTQLGLAAPAAASTPQREPVVFPDELVLPAGPFCPWEGLVTFPLNREVATTFFNADGTIARVVITGALRVTVTNVDNGESVTLNIPGVLVTVNDVVTYTGRNIIFPVEGSLDLVAGRVVVTVDSEGFQHPVEVAGLSIDVCTLLA